MARKRIVERPATNDNGNTGTTPAAAPVVHHCKGCGTQLQHRANYCILCFSTRLKPCPECMQRKPGGKYKLRPEFGVHVGVGPDADCPACRAVGVTDLLQLRHGRDQCVRPPCPRCGYQQYLLDETRSATA
jgi:hypothetical protein